MPWYYNQYLCLNIVSEDPSVVWVILDMVFIMFISFWYLESQHFLHISSLTEGSQKRYQKYVPHQQLRIFSIRPHPCSQNGLRNEFLSFLSSRDTTILPTSKIIITTKLFSTDRFTYLSSTDQK